MKKECTLWSDSERIPLIAKESDIPTKNHTQALIEAYQIGKSRQSLTTLDLNRWYEMLYGVKIEPKEQEALQKLLQHLDMSLQSSRTREEAIYFVTLLADFLCEFLGLKAYPQSSTLAKLIANYICARCHRPLIVFYKGEGDLCDSPSLMRLYIAKKIRETIFAGRDKMMHFTEGNLINGIYTDKDGNKLIVQWDELVREEDKWQQMANAVPG